MVVMGEGDINDCWSLLAIVNESSRMTQSRAQLVINDNPLKTTPFATTPQLDYIEMDHSYDGYKSFFDDQFMSMNNSSGFWLPSTSSAPAVADVTSSEEEWGGFWLSSAEGTVTTTPAADVTSPEEELRGPFLVPYKPPVVCNNAKAEPPVVVTGGMASNPLVEQNSRQHPRPRDVQMIPNQRLPAAVTRGRKKKKIENRTIVRLTAEELPKSDKWSWRKYGQKPIKGSKYPRNYYRCSTIHGCRARKQVERCPEDDSGPDTYIVSYSNYHHHPYPPIRNTPGPRVRYTTKSESNPPPKLESSTNTVFGPVGGANGVITIDDDDDEFVAGDSSFSSGEMNERYIYNSADFQMPVMNSMTYSELLTVTEQQNGEGSSSGFTITDNNNNDNYYNSYCNENNNNNNDDVGYNWGCDPNVNMGVRREENGSGYGVGNGELYAPAPATNGSGYGVGNGEMCAPAPATNGSDHSVGNGDVYAPAPATTNGSGYGVGNGEMYAPAPITTNGSGCGVGNGETYAPAPVTTNGSGCGVGNGETYAPALVTTNGSGCGVGNGEMYAPAPAMNGLCNCVSNPAPAMNGSGCSVGNPAPAMNGPGYSVGNPAPAMNGPGPCVGNREMYAPAPAMNGSGLGVGNREMYALAPTINGSGSGVGNREMYAPAPAMNRSAFGFGNREMYAPTPATVAGVHQPPPNYVGPQSKHIWNIEMIKNARGFFFS